MKKEFLNDLLPNFLHYEILLHYKIYTRLNKNYSLK